MKWANAEGLMVGVRKQCACTTKWEAATDTVTEDTILYVGWQRELLHTSYEAREPNKF